MTNTTKEGAGYIPYGEEWQKEMSKFPKAELIKMLGKSLKKNSETERDYNAQFHPTQPVP